MWFEDSLSLQDPEAAEALPGVFCSHCERTGAIPWLHVADPP